MKRLGAVVGLQIGLPQQHLDGPGGKPWTSSLPKRRVDGPLLVRTAAIDGDGAADPDHHGGIEKPVFVYPIAHYESWADELGEGVVPVGAFGENLLVEAIDETEICIGDLVRIDSTVLEVSQPRRPCWKPALLLGVTDLVERIQRHGRTGWYFRVVTEGQIANGATPELLERRHPTWTVDRANRVVHHGDGGAAAALELSEVAELAPSWRHSLSSAPAQRRAEDSARSGTGGSAKVER